jgi:hypothetical protein
LPDGPDAQDLRAQARAYGALRLHLNESNRDEALVAKEQGAAEEFRVAPTFGFVLLVGLLVWLSLDLTQPRHGIIALSREPMERVLRTME